MSTFWMRLCTGLGLVLLIWVTWDWVTPRDVSHGIPDVPVGVRGAERNGPSLADQGGGRTPEELPIEQLEEGALEAPGPQVAPVTAPVTVVVRRGLTGVGLPASVVSLQPMDGRGMAPLSATTDAAGQCVFPAVPTGPVRLSVLRATASWERSVTVERANRFLLELPPAASLQIHVVDPDGAPVHGASVWMSTAGARAMGAVVGSTGPAGELELLDVEGERDFFALHPEYGPSARVPHKGQAPLQLVLASAGGALVCRIKDVRGAPIAGAEVLVGEPTSGLQRAPTGDQVWSPGARMMRTDARGEARFEGLPLGGVRVQARAHGVVGGERSVVIRAGESAAVDLVLETAGQVWGVVRMADGAPAAQATVWTADASWSGRQLVQTAADGSYWLAGLGPGSVQVLATRAGAGEAAGMVDVAAGASLRLDLELRAGPAVGGILRAEDGAALAGWRVSVAPPHAPSAWHVTGFSDGEGRFHLADCPDGALVLEVREPNQRIPRAAMVVPGVTAGDLELEVTVPLAAFARSFVEGQVVDAHGAALVGAEVFMSDVATRLGPAPATTDAAGAFRLGPVHAGAYEVFATLEGFAEGARTRVMLDVGETEYGVALRLERAGRLVVELDPAGAAEISAGILVTLRSATGEDVDSFWLDAEGGRSSGLAPGTYDVVVQVGDAVVAHSTQEVRADAETTWRPTW